MSSIEPEKPILITGASGLVGGALLRRITADGGSVLALSRNPEAQSAAQESGFSFRPWNGLDFPSEALSSSSAIVHLAGEPIFSGVLTRSRRRKIFDSRVKSTRRLAQQLEQLRPEQRPSCLICASAVGIYGDRGDEELTEDSTLAHSFLADVCRSWEEAAQEAEEVSLRVCSIRLGLVLSKHGGALPRMMTSFRFGLGGPIGDGRQWVPWIQIDDLVRLILWLIEREDLHGVFNAVSPKSIRNLEFSRAVGSAMHRPSRLRVPRSLVRLALGDLAGELVDSRKVIPARALAEGFHFEGMGVEEEIMGK